MRTILLLAFVAALSNTASAGRITVPNDETKQANAKLVRELYAGDISNAKSVAEKASLGKKLLAEADSTPKDHAGRYALLELARTTTVSAGDAVTAMAVVDRFGAFNLDLVALRLQTVKGLSDTCVTSSQARDLATVANAFAKTVLADDDYTTALQAASLAVAAAKRSKDIGLVKSTVTTSKLITEYHAEYKALGDNIINAFEWGNPAPNVAAAVGRFRCYVKGDFEHGLPLLAIGDDLTLRQMATRDLVLTSDPEELVSRGNAWLTMIPVAPAKVRANLEARASYWFRLALPSLTGLERAKIAKQLEDLAGADSKVNWDILAVSDAFKVGDGNMYGGGCEIATNGSGNFVVVYVAGSNHDGYNLYGKLYGPNCKPTSKEFKINVKPWPITPGHMRPAVAMGPKGQFVVVWEVSVDAKPKVHARAFGATGKPLGQEFSTSIEKDINQYNPVIAYSPTTGRYMIAWESTDEKGHGEIYAKLFRPDAIGSVGGIGPAFRVNTTQEGGQHNPAIACDGLGRFIVAWWGTTAHDPEGIAFQRFDGEGNPIGREIPGNDSAPLRQTRPSVAACNTGEFIIAWEVDGANQIMARLFDQDSEPRMVEFRLGESYLPQDDRYGVTTAMAGDGHFVIAFHGTDPVGKHGVYAARFFPNGVKAGADFVISNPENTRDSNPGVILTEHGLVATWQHALKDRSGEVFAKHFTAKLPQLNPDAQAAK